MNPTNPNGFFDEELHHLLDELCNETIDQESHARLQSILNASPAARDKYLEQIDLHFDLKRLYSSAGALSAESAKLLEAISAPMPSLSNEGRARQVYRREPEPSRFWRPAVVVACAGTLVLVAAVAWLLGSKTNLERDLASATSKSASSVSTPSVDTLVQPLVMMKNAASAKFFGEETPEEDSPMRLEHEYALTRGMIELHFPAGATAIIEAPAIFRISTISRLVLTTGVCSVHAPDGAQGFQVDTPFANVIDLGTRFVVEVSQSGESSVQVVEGAAELVPKDSKTGSSNAGQPNIRLQEHQAQRLLPAGNVLATEMPYDEITYKRNLPDRIVKFDAVEDENGCVGELSSVTVQRGRRDYHYPVDELVGIDLIHYRSASNAFMISPENVLSDQDDKPRSRLIDRDRSLCSGLINPGGQRQALTNDPVLNDPSAPDKPTTPGIGFVFKSPVINGDGPDVVFFEIQTIVNPESGDLFHISPLKFSAGLHSHSLVQYDIDLLSPHSRFISSYRLYRASSLSLTLAQALSTDCDTSDAHAVRAKVVAVGIDLSDLGYPLGARVDGLFLQDALDDVNFFDPVFIAGLPTTP